MQNVEQKVSRYALRAIDNEADRVAFVAFDRTAALDDPREEAPPEPSGIEKLDRIVRAAGVRFEVGGDQAAHVTTTDGEEWMQFPRASRFTSDEIRRNVLLHELSHWAATRVGQDSPGLTGRDGMLFSLFGIAPPDYNREEVTAELAAALVQDRLGDFSADLLPRVGSYVGGYLEKFPEEERAATIERATADARARADYLLSLA